MLDTDASSFFWKSLNYREILLLSVFIESTCLSRTEKKSEIKYSIFEYQTFNV